MRGLGLSLILVVVVAIMGIGWLVTELDFLTRDTDLVRDELAAYERIATDFARTLDSLPAKQDFLRIWQQQSALQLTLGEAADFPVPPELRTDFEAGKTLVLESEGRLSIHARLPDSGAVLSLVLPDDVARATRLRPSLILTLLFYAGVVATMLLWLYPLVRRLLTLRSAAEAFGRGELQARVTTSQLSVIGTIEHEFNRMAERTQALIADNKLLGRAVSHNLKTPLARLRFGLDTLAETTDETTREKYTRRISRDLTEMETLVEKLLQYARLEEANIQLQKQNTALNGFVAQLLADLDAPNIEFRGSGTDVRVDTDPHYLAIQLHNLVGNALQYARTRVRISVTSAAGTATIVVEDDGPGIAPEERAVVLEPFQRGSNSSNVPGHGMGLAIVARIARWLGAEIRIAASPELGGAAVSLQFDARTV